jgi:hypothetical protein
VATNKDLMALPESGWRNGPTYDAKAVNRGRGVLTLMLADDVTSVMVTVPAGKSSRQVHVLIKNEDILAYARLVEAVTR